MDPELREKLRTRRLLTDGEPAVPSTPEWPVSLLRGRQREPAAETARPDLQDATARRLKKIAGTRKVDTGGEPPHGETPHNDAHRPCNINVVRGNAAPDGEPSMTAAGEYSEPIEYLMLELLPLLPEHIAERLMRGVRANESRALRLRSAVEELSCQITELQQRKPSPEAASDHNDHNQAQQLVHRKGVCPWAASVLAHQAGQNWWAPQFSLPFVCLGVVIGLGALVCVGAAKGAAEAHLWPGRAMNGSAVASPRYSQLQDSMKIARHELERCKLQHHHTKQELLSLQERPQCGMHPTTVDSHSPRSHRRSSTQHGQFSKNGAASGGDVLLGDFAAQQRRLLADLGVQIETVRQELSACLRCGAALGIADHC